MGLFGKIFRNNDGIIKAPIQGGDAANANQEPAPLDKSQPGTMVIDDTFSISGRGAVAVGQVSSGFFYIGQKAVVVSNSGEYPVTVTGVEVFHKALDYAGPGTKVGIMIDGIDRKTLEACFELRGLPEEK